jgi:hypothetical protein
MSTHLFRRGRVLGDGLGTLGDGVLGKLTREDEADRGLDLSGRDGGLLVVGGKLRGLGSDTLEDIWQVQVRMGRPVLVSRWNWTNR